MATLGWTPIQKGTIYCSLACGGGCTKAEYNEAVKGAKALAKRLGEGWEPEVTENLGWYYSASKDVLTVNPPQKWALKRGDKNYTAYLNTTPQFIAYHTNPIIAVDLAIGLLDQHIRSCQKQRKQVTPIIIPIATRRKKAA